MSQDVALAAQAGADGGPLSVAAQYGLLGIAVLVFGLVIKHLYNRLSKQEIDFAIERKALHEERLKIDAAHDVELEAARADFEAKLRKNAEDYTEAVRADMHESRSREDIIRREFSELMETIATKASEASDATRQVLDKIYERFIGPRKSR